MRTATIFLFIAVISIPLGGYQFGVKDQYVTIPIYLRYLDPTLYPNDYYYPQPNEGKSLHSPLLALTRPLFPDIPTQFFILYSLFHTLWLYALYRFARFLLKDKKAALLSLLFFITPKWVGGTGAMTYELSLVYRTISMPFALLSLVWTLERRYLYAALTGVIACAIHPLTGLYVGFPIYVILCNRLRQRLHLPPLSTYFAIPIPFLLLILISLLVKNPLHMDPEWFTIVQNRLPFAFLSRWDLLDTGALFLFVILGVTAYALQPTVLRNNKETAFAFGVTTIAALGVPALAEISKIAPLLQVQFARALTLPATAVIIFFSQAVLARLWNKRPWTVAILLPLAILTIVYPARDPDTHFLLAPDRSSPWVDVQLWAKENTPKTAVFLTNPFLSGFRVFSERSPVVEYKDGTAAIFSRTHAFAWKRRIEAIKDVDSMTLSELLTLNGKYPYDYLVRKKNTQSLPIPLAYENVDFRVYQFTPGFGNF